MSIRPLMIAGLLVASGAGAMLPQSRPAKAAKTFKLDSIAPSPEATPMADATPSPQPAASAETTPAAAATPDAAPTLAAPAVPDSAAVTAPAGGGTHASDAAPTAGEATASPAAPASTGLRASFTVDTPIADLIADPAAKAVLDKDLPGLTTDDNLDKFAKLGLRQFQPLTGGQLTDAMLLKVARHLASLSGPMLAPVAPATGGTSKRNRDASR